MDPPNKLVELLLFVVLEVLFGRAKMLVLELAAMEPNPPPPSPKTLLDVLAVPNGLLDGCCEEFIVDVLVL